MAVTVLTSATFEEEVLKEVLSGYNYNDSQISIIDAREVISNNESATEAIRQKKDSSLVVGLNYIAENEDDKQIAGFVSAFVVGCLACKFMIDIVKRGKLIWFAVYCALAGMVAIITNLA